MNLTRRTFNILLGSLSLLGFKKRPQEPNVDLIQQEILSEENDYLEILVLPKEFRNPSAQTLEVLYNHIKAGKSKHSIKEFVLSKSKSYRVPLK